ncbi:hypothetical protein [Dipodfec virus UOA04_Rod_1082]|nr:hypothetical protein [Dipodfec virus UOA04_Rod_1082]
MRRRRLTRRGSKLSFRRGLKVRRKNLRARPMRGGFRI